MQIQRAEYIPKDDAIANGVISNSYYPPNGVYYQNYPIQGYGQPFVQPGGQPYYIQPGTMQQGVQPILPPETNVTQPAAVIDSSQKQTEKTEDTPINDNKV